MFKRRVNLEKFRFRAQLATRFDIPAHYNAKPALSAGSKLCVQKRIENVIPCDNQIFPPLLVFDYNISYGRSSRSYNQLLWRAG